MKLAVVGAGKMGGAVLTGAMRAGVLKADDIGIYHPDARRRTALAERYGVQGLDDDAVHHAERVLIAVKPQAFDEVAPLVAERRASYLSIMAGVPADTVARRVGSRRVIRAMPNLGARLRMSATAVAPLPEATESDVAFAEELFGAVGEVHRMPERLFDAFTGLAGSGPAFVALVAESLADGGVRSGFGRSQAQALVRQVLLASAHLLEEQGPAELKNEVASAGGTAIAGLRALEGHRTRYAFLRAVEEATERAGELADDEDA